MARSVQNDVDFQKFLKQPQTLDHDIVIFCFEEAKDRAGFLDLLVQFMDNDGFRLMTTQYMYEIVVAAFIHKSKHHLISGPITTSTKACGGIGAIKFGNKGGVQMNFTVNGRTYNILGCHLVHGQDNRIKRDEMMADVLKGLKYERKELDPDITCDFNFILGDLNYRFESTYEEMIDNGMINQSLQLIDTHDQLKISMRGGNIPIKLANGEEIYRLNSPKYPSYHEPAINFYPTYKRNE